MLVVMFMGWPLKAAVTHPNWLMLMLQAAITTTQQSMEQLGATASEKGTLKASTATAMIGSRRLDLLLHCKEFPLASTSTKHKLDRTRSRTHPGSRRVLDG